MSRDVEMSEIGKVSVCTDLGNPDIYTGNNCIKINEKFHPCNKVIAWCSKQKGKQTINFNVARVGTGVHTRCDERLLRASNTESRRSKS